MLQLGPQLKHFGPPVIANVVLVVEVHLLEATLHFDSEEISRVGR